MALRSSGLDADNIDYINAHGTSTPQGDMYETKAVRSVFKEHADKLAVSSTKGATGHMLGAAGSVEMVLTAKALQTGILPPTINIENQDRSAISITWLTPLARWRSMPPSVTPSDLAVTTPPLPRPSFTATLPGWTNRAAGASPVCQR